jgi:glutathione peroxidase-family protein
MGMKQYQSEESNEVARNMRFKYETLESLFEKTDAYNEQGLSLFKKLKESVW